MDVFEEVHGLLDAFLPFAGQHYAHQRNYVGAVGMPPTVSRLSPYIQRRVLTEWQVIEAVLAQHDFKDAQAFISEVVWRGYFKGWLEQYPSIWQAYRRDLKALLQCLALDAELAARLKAAQEGQTGIACFDYWMNKLSSTGYLHNHERLWCASIWIFTLKLPWQLGADTFLCRLLDGDAASNTLSWRWVAGLHTKGKHYLARADNIHTFTNGQFNPVGMLDESACALDDDGDYPLVPFRPPAVPNRIEGAWALLVTPNDYAVQEVLKKAAELPRRVFLIEAYRATDGCEKSTVVQAFDKTVSMEAEKWLQSMGLSVQKVPLEGAASIIRTALRKQGIQQLVTAYQPLGY